MGYTKLFSDIVMSTIWREPDHVRLVWITMLALRDRWHTVQASVPGLADAARVSLESCRDAIKILSSPDPDSRTKDFDGRRIEETEGGWLILNGEKFRQRMSLDDRREYQRIKQKEYRDNKKSFTNRLQSGQRFTQAETEEETETKKKRESPNGLTPLAVFWNLNSNGLPKVQAMTNLRKKKESRLIETHGEEKFREAVLLAAKSKFCCGDNDRGWKATYDWMISNDENVLKVLEGKYGGKAEKSDYDKILESVKGL